MLKHIVANTRIHDALLALACRSAAKGPPWLLDMGLATCLTTIIVGLELSVVVCKVCNLQQCIFRPVSWNNLAQERNLERSRGWFEETLNVL